MSEPVILCVDDEKTVLDGLQTVLGREFSSNYVIEIAESAEEALEIIHDYLLQHRDIPVVITDQMMPGMKGHEFLAEVHRISPATFKILLTGLSDIQAITSAVNQANLYRYISKPWDRTDLVLTIKEAVNSYNKDVKLELQNRMLQEYNDQLEEKVKERTHRLEEERRKSKELLLSILPRETAEELLLTGETRPRHFRNVSILFTDFVGFTSVAQKIGPEGLVTTLNECFSAFDEITDRYSLERIKTIGDAYMCVGGAPLINDTNPTDIINAAWKILEWMKVWNADRAEKNLPAWNVRIGAHCGEIIAGVIGKKKFAYDIWGDTVNIASRLEAHSEVNRINISQQLYEKVRHLYSCEYRGEVEVKNIGSLPMYYVNGKIGQ